ncbi:uncharacterized protein LAJ45_09548 [Morchella importuna]|uniref:uncharacterized protein n=1 Tax=Morchella importuna TaxID=1174673 RepID=UPI001E8DE707|nr:uncharacterized protein LAJ45_09548 [Morchella importuna]KAH8146355.1 hypothetical protein LAJ45_09548 [Morchella importuna]
MPANRGSSSHSSARSLPVFPWSNHHIWADDKQDFGNTRISVEPWQCLYMFFFLSCLPARISISRMTQREIAKNFEIQPRIPRPFQIFGTVRFRTE